MANLVNLPKVIFFDAVGTLFGIKGTVGHIYGAIAQEFDVQADPKVLNTAFMHNFQAAPKMAFPNVERSQIPKYEYEWWKAIALASFTQTGFIHQFKDFDSYFERLYQFFTTKAAWYVYEEVPRTLQHLQALGIELAVISNFDSRIYAVLKVLDLSQYFASVTISTEAGAAKPEQQIFVSAMKKHDLASSICWHIGDSFTEDYEGAKNAGIQAIWLDRSGVSTNSIFSLESILESGLT